MSISIAGLSGVGTYEEIKSNGSGALLVATVGGSGSTVITPGTTAGQAPSNSTSGAYEANRVVKASAGTLFGFTIYNSLAATQFIQIHDAASLPADGAVPVLVISVPASTSVALDLNPFGRRFTTGIVICNSSTGPTKTIGAANLWVDAQFT